MSALRLCLALSAVLLAASLVLPQKKNTRAVAREAASGRRMYAELERAPDKARAKRNPLANDPEAPLAGRKLFERHCAECHGGDAGGGEKAPSLRAPEVQNAADGALFWVLTNGVVRRGMPVWSKLPEARRWQVVSYIKTLGASAAPKTEADARRPPPSASR